MPKPSRPGKPTRFVADQWDMQPNNMVGLQTRRRKDVVAQLVRQIVSGVYPPGSTLPTELELARMFGVSRALLREAMRTVGEKGLIEVRQGIGTRVRPPTAWNQLDPIVLFERIRTTQDECVLRDLLEFRAMLDMTAAELAAQRRTEDDVARLAQSLQAMRQALDDPLVYAQHDAAFHEAIADAAHNQLIAAARRPLAQVLMQAWELTDRLPGRMSASLLGHEQIAAAIAEQDAPRARQAMAQHLRQFEDDIREALRRFLTERGQGPKEGTAQGAPNWTDPEGD